MKKKRFAAVAAGYFLIIGGFLIGSMAGSRVVSTIAEGERAQQRHVVILDPGHGGEDGGATSCTGVLESGINLEISLRLRDMLHFLGYDTQMIRTTDTAVYTQGNSIAQKKVSDLKERVRMVNSGKNALLVSIHQNYFTDSRYAGAQVFSAGDAASQALAKQLQTAFVQTLNPGSRRQAKLAKGIYLMEHIECPGVLVECGFLSSPEEEAKLRSAAYQKQVAAVIAAVTSTYFADS